MAFYPLRVEMQDCCHFPKAKVCLTNSALPNFLRRFITCMGAPFPLMKHSWNDDALMICSRKICHSVQIWRFEADLCQWKTCSYRKLRTFVSITNNVSEGISSVPNLLNMDWGENLLFVTVLGGEEVKFAPPFWFCANIFSHVYHMNIIFVRLERVMLGEHFTYLGC